ncbi:hypothetical protein [Aquicoccus sp. SU-CL01552]|uniref:hypothetical protein n=1 Tax=Aquicoccus sp. SU-CL01552 TaxID=3127656 RepID=UPI003342D864
MRFVISQKCLYHSAFYAEDTLDHKALLRYWRSALRTDPRGATTQVADTHGVEWALVSGRGPIAPEEGENLIITIGLEALAPSFREALVRREGHENAMAIGWPMAVTRVRGVPAVQPVGLAQIGTAIDTWCSNTDLSGQET